MTKFQQDGIKIELKNNMIHYLTTTDYKFSYLVRFIRGVRCVFVCMNEHYLFMEILVDIFKELLQQNTYDEKKLSYLIDFFD